MYTGRRLIGKTWYEFGSDGRLYQLLRGRMSADEKEIVVTITPPAGQGKNYSNIMAAAWSQQDGQDDLVWYNATANGDGTYTIRVPMCKYNVVGRYLVHVYNHGIHGQLLGGLTFQNTHVVGHTDTVASDSSTCVSAGQVKYVCRYCGASHTSSTPAKHHTVSAVVDSECRTMTVTMNAGNGHAHSNVRFAVWSSVNGQDDLTWYTAKKNSSGQWTCTVPLVNHNSTGTYFIHVYSPDSGQSRLIGNTTAQVAKLPAPDTVTAQVSDNCRTMSIRLDTARSYSGIRFAVWSSAGGQDDLVWYTAKNGGSGSWTYDVDLARHNTTGTYFIHAYGNNKKNLVAHTTAYVEKIPGPEMKAALSADGRYLDVTLTGRGDLTQVWFPTWSQDNGQDDLRWHEAARQTDGSWTCRIALSDHSGTGVYFIHAYGNTKKNLVAHTTVTVPQASQPSQPEQPPQPVRSGMQAVLSADGRYLDVTLAGRSDLTKVWFPTWSAVNGQDDLRWYEATKQPDGSWTCRVPLANHKSAGGFFLHAYGNNKKNLVAHTTASVSQVVSPQVWTRLHDGGRYMTVTLTGRSDLTKVWFPTWGAANGQDDLQWYQAVRQSNGDWSYTVNLSQHRDKGTYFIHVYGNTRQNLVAHTTAYVS